MLCETCSVSFARRDAECKLCDASYTVKAARYNLHGMRHACKDMVWELCGFSCVGQAMSCMLGCAQTTWCNTCG
eukprot:4518244-Pyramimonas_sp.AAC.1